MDTTKTTTAFRAQDSADRPRRDCTHLDAPHQHGTRVAYVTDRCRCTACRAANRDAEHHRTASLRKGCWQPYIDAEPVRMHLQLLRQHGVGLDQIEKISHTPKRTIRRLLREPVASPHRIRTGTADKLLAVQISPEHIAPRSQVDASDTRARIQALVDAGHSIPALARALGKSPVSLRRTLNRRTVTAHTAASVGDLYDRLRTEACAADRRMETLQKQQSAGNQNNRLNISQMAITPQVAP